MFQKLGKQRISVFILLDGSPCGGELSRCHLKGLALWIAGKSHRQGHLRKRPAASSDDAGFLEAEIAISFWCRGANDDVVNQLREHFKTGARKGRGVVHLIGWAASWNTILSPKLTMSTFGFAGFARCSGAAFSYAQIAP